MPLYKTNVEVQLQKFVTSQTLYHWLDPKIVHTKRFHFTVLYCYLNHRCVVSVWDMSRVVLSHLSRLLDASTAITRPQTAHHWTGTCGGIRTRSPTRVVSAPSTASRGRRWWPTTRINTPSLLKTPRNSSRQSTFSVTPFLCVNLLP